MYRRDVLKALAAIPFATALSGCEAKTDDKSDAALLEIHLDGAFALVIQENKGNSLLAFSPRPKREDEQHQFYLNGSRKPEDPGKSYNFKLSPEGLEHDSEPDISPGLKDFYFKTEHWRIGDSLVTIELPAPKRITFSGHRSNVTFLAGHRQAWMPTNHVLKYEAKDPGRVKLECSDGNIRCLASPDSFPGVTRFFFEIGPKRVLDYNQSHMHAINFFNYILHQSFPDLEARYKLTPENARGEKQAQIAPGLVPAVFQYGAQEVQLRRASYVVDCEFAGPLVGTKTAPQK